jgi:hypothetical protein
MRIRPVLVTLVSAALLLVGSAFGQVTLNVGATAEASGLDPRRVNDVPSFQRIYTMFEPLIVFEKDLSFRPRLATEWSFSDDGSVITFKLREGVLFHHGTEFTSADVKYTIEWLQNPDNPVLNRNLWETIARVETPDPYTVVMHGRADQRVDDERDGAHADHVPADIGDDETFVDQPERHRPLRVRRVGPRRPPRRARVPRLLGRRARQRRRGRDPQHPRGRDPPAGVRGRRARPVPRPGRPDRGAAPRGEHRLGHPHDRPRLAYLGFNQRNPELADAASGRPSTT